MGEDRFVGVERVDFVRLVVEESLHFERTARVLWRRLPVALSVATFGGQHRALESFVHSLQPMVCRWRNVVSDLELGLL